MTSEQVEFYRKASETRAISDEMNTLSLFSITHTHLLIRIVSGELDARVLAAWNSTAETMNLVKISQPAV